MAKSSDILTRRLRITPFEERHITEVYLSWLNDRVLMRYSEQRHARHTVESCRAYRSRFETGPGFFWAIEEMEQGLGHIGNINAHVDTVNRIADVGLLIGDARGAGRHYGLEAWIGVCGFLFGNTNVRKVTGGCIADNVPMLKIMQRAGMKEDGVRRRHYLVEGREVDVVHMAFFKEDWSAKIANRDKTIVEYLGIG